jgi:hypothetical protein
MSDDEIQVRTGVVRRRPPRGEFLAFSRTRHVEADFSRKRVASLAPEGCYFERCDFSGVRIDSACFGSGEVETEYVDCTFDGARINVSTAGIARFTGCSFERVKITGWLCGATELVECRFSGRLRRCVFSAKVSDFYSDILSRATNEIRDNDFSRCHFDDVSFLSGVDLTRQRLPSEPGTLYVADAPAALRAARSSIVTWSDLDRRRTALKLLDFYDDLARDGQQQLLLYAADAAPEWASVVPDVWHELAGAQ